MKITAQVQPAKSFSKEKNLKATDTELSLFSSEQSATDEISTESKKSFFSAIKGLFINEHASAHTCTSHTK